MFDALDSEYDAGRYSRQPWWYRQGQHLQQINDSVAIEEKPSQPEIDRFFAAMKILWTEKKVTK